MIKPDQVAVPGRSVDPGTMNRRRSCPAILGLLLLEFGCAQPSVGIAPTPEPPLPTPLPVPEFDVELARAPRITLLPFGADGHRLVFAEHFQSFVALDSQTSTLAWADARTAEVRILDQAARPRGSVELSADGDQIMFRRSSASVETEASASGVSSRSHPTGQPPGSSAET